MKVFIKFLIITIIFFLFLFSSLFLLNITSDILSKPAFIFVILFFFSYVLLIFIGIVIPIILNIYRFNKKRLSMFYANSNYFQSHYYRSNLNDMDTITEYLTDTLKQLIAEKQFEDNLKEKIKRILTDLNFIFLRINKSGDIIEHNKVYTDYFKTTENIKKIIPNSVFIKLAKEQITNFITEHKLNKEKHPVSFEWTALVYYKQSIDPTIYLISKDQSHRRNLESKIIDMKKFDALGRLASGLSHDFKNYLTCINGYLELLEENKKFDHEIVEAALQTGKNAFKLVEQISSFSKSSSLFFQEISVAQLYDNTRQFIKSLITEDIQINMENNINKDLVIIGDKDKLLQVILNLTINAKDAILQKDKNNTIQQRGSIQIKFDLLEFNKIHTVIKNNFNLKRDKYIKITIKDNGTGIPAKQVQEIFEPFYTTKTKGTGLGLSIVLGIIKKHSAGLEINTIKDKGTTFALYLPIKINKQ